MEIQIHTLANVTWYKSLEGLIFHVKIFHSNLFRSVREEASDRRTDRRTPHSQYRAVHSVAQ